MEDVFYSKTIELGGANLEVLNTPDPDSDSILINVGDDQISFDECCAEKVCKLIMEAAGAIREARNEQR